MKLRARTVMLHARLDRMVSLSCVGGTVGLGRLLTIHYDALTVLVPALEQAGAHLVCPGWEGRSRLKALEEDLRVLRMPPHKTLAYRPSFTSQPEIWGALYAIEGSRLGNRIMLRRVMECSAEEVHHATQFLAQGLEDCTTWRDFVVRLDGLQYGDEEFEAAVLGAERVFKTYLTSEERHLRRFGLQYQES